jgi:O-antigen/teichoic acid export membrane protein
MFGKVLGPASRLGMGSLLGQLTFLMLAPVLARAYEPVDFGVFAIFLTATSIDVVAALGFDRAMYRPPSDRLAAQLATLGIGASALFSIVLVIPGVCLLQALPWLPMEFRRMTSLCWLAGISVLAFGLTQVATAAALRDQKYHLLAGAKSLQLPTMALCQVAFAASGAGSIGLVYGHVAGQCIATMLLATPLLRIARRSSMRWNELVRAAHSFAAFPRSVLLGTGLNSVNLQLPAAVVGSVFGSAPAGLYGFTARIVGAPLSLLTQSIGNAFLGVASQRVRQEEHADLRRVIAATIWIQLVLLVPLAVAIVAAPTIFAYAFGETWRAAGNLLQFMSPMILTQFLITPFHGLIDMYGKPHLHARREVVRASLIVCSIGLIVGVQPGETVAVLLLSSAIGVGYLVGAVQLYGLYQAVLVGPQPNQPPFDGHSR